MRTLECFAEGRLELRIGHADDYARLARFHYAAGRPASFALTLVVEYLACGTRGRQIAAAGVLSYPALNCRAREGALGLRRVPQRWRWAYVNRHLRTISRVIVHPQFRGIGLATVLVRELLRQSPVRYVEAISRLGNHHPLFARAGMIPVNADKAAAPAYYLADRCAIEDSLCGNGL